MLHKSKSKAEKNKGKPEEIASNFFVRSWSFEIEMASASAAGGSAGQGSGSSSKRKRTNPVPTTSAGIYSGVQNSVENKDVDLLCPICMDIYNECYISKCGHSFCFECIGRCLEQNQRCPKCNFHLDGKNDIFPNFALNELVAKHKNVEENRRKHNIAVANLLSQPEASELKEILFEKAPKLGLTDIEYIMNLLSERWVIFNLLGAN